MDSFRRGLHASFLLFRFSPGLAASAIVALAMGIGFTTTMFSIVHGATRPLPVPEPDEIVAIEKTRRGATADPNTRGFDYRAWSKAQSFEALAAFENVALNLTGDRGEPERVTGTAVTPNAFGLLQQSAFVGRPLQSFDVLPGAPPVVVLNHAFWQRRFGGDRNIVGTAIRLSGVPHIVVGVMPPRFGFPTNASFWIPLVWDDNLQPGVGRRVQAFGRLAQGATRDHARTELDTITRQLAQESPLTHGGAATRVVPFTEIETPPEAIRGLYLLIVAVSFVLLIACSNVASLLLARAAMRARDVAVRMALGATRRQLVIEQLTETLSLSVIATIIGLALAHAATRVFAANTSHIIEAFWVDFRIDAVVVIFASLLAAIGAAASGVGPALKVSRSDVSDVLKDRSSTLSAGRLNRGLVSVQVALACGLLALTMVLARSSVAIRSVPWPIDPETILTLEFELDEVTSTDPTARSTRLNAISEAVASAPGVVAVGLTNALPGRGSGSRSFTLDQPPIDDRTVQTTSVSFVDAGFFDVMSARALSGRLLTRQDDATASHTAVVNESFVRRFSPDRDPLGRRVFLGNRPLTIIGVVADLMVADVQEQRQDGFYASVLQTRPFGIRMMVRGARDDGQSMSATALIDPVRAAIRRVDPEMPLTEIFTLYEAVYRDKRVLDVLSTLFLVFGVSALLLTAIGLYGVVSFAVAQRTREIGIRLALGATRPQVLRLVVGQGGRQIMFGLAAGLVLAIALSRGFAAAIEGIPPADAPLLSAIIGALAVTVLVAVIMPARRAARLEIVKALRVD